jgi:predicted nucleic acid-binding protein
MAAEHVFLDTNVLLAASDPGRSSHAAALDVFNSWPARGTILYASGQIFREYLVVATRPRGSNGLALPQVDALSNVVAFRERTHLLSEDTKVADRLRALLLSTTCTGKQIHDANVVATMLVHNLETLVTSNVSDFQRFFDHVMVRAL